MNLLTFALGMLASAALCSLGAYLWLRIYPVVIGGRFINAQIAAQRVIDDQQRALTEAMSTASVVGVVSGESSEVDWEQTVAGNAGRGRVDKGRLN